MQPLAQWSIILASAIEDDVRAGPESWAAAWNKAASRFTSGFMIMRAGIHLPD